MEIQARSKDLLTERLRQIHEDIRTWLPRIGRIAVALYDHETGLLKTFIDSTEDGSPLEHYEADIAKVDSLRDLAESRRPRTINDLSVLEPGDSLHTRSILAKGYRSSHTVPIVHNGAFHGFVFFNAGEKNYFTETAVHNLGVYAQLVGLLCITEFTAIRTLQAAVKTAREITQIRDEETGCHLTRMSNFARLIALDLAEEHSLTDEFIEFMFHFSPLHDIGKIAVRDGVLLKAGPLTVQERAEMQNHVDKGAEIIEKMIIGFQMEHLPKIEMLKNIVLCHHEAVDGSGYPQGLVGDEIPLEARIVAVADVFDALTSARPYKKAWSIDEAFEYLSGNAAKLFDADCVAALMRQRDKVEEIQKKFHEDVFG